MNCNVCVSAIPLVAKISHTHGRKTQPLILLIDIKIINEKKMPAEELPADVIEARRKLRERMGDSGVCVF